MWRIFVVLTVVVSCFTVYSAYSAAKEARDQNGKRYAIDEDSCWDAPKHGIKVTSASWRKSCPI